MHGKANISAKFDFSSLPGRVQNILEKLRSHRLDFWLVGGFVRDWVGGCTSHRDIDIGVRCDVHRLRDIVGGKVVKGKHSLVKTTGCDLVPIDDLEADLRQRDFTVNAMAIGADGWLVDPLGGARDAASHVFRMARESIFEEDSVRLLRLCRLAARLDWSIEADTASRVKAFVPTHCRRLPTPHNGLRLGLELLKSFEDPHPSKFLRMAHDFRLLFLFTPHLDTCFNRPKQMDNTLARCDSIQAGNLGARMAALLRDLSSGAKHASASKSASLARKFLRMICWNYVASNIYPAQCRWSAGAIVLAIRLQHTDLSRRDIDWLAILGNKSRRCTVEQIYQIRRESFGEELTAKKWQAVRSNVLRHATNPDLSRQEQQVALRFYGYSRKMTQKILDGMEIPSSY